MIWLSFFTGVGVSSFLFLSLALWRASVARDRAAGENKQWRAKEERFRDEILERHDEGLVAQERQAEALQDIAALLKSREG